MAIEIRILREQKKQLMEILETILDEGTGCISDPPKRVWPLHAHSHRTARKLLDEIIKEDLDI
jgi:hypothetical protein